MEGQVDFITNGKDTVLAAQEDPSSSPAPA